MTIKESLVVEIERDQLPMEEIHDALRAINRHIFEAGLTREEIERSAENALWLEPLLHNHPWSHYITGLHRHIGIEADEVWTQILLQFPEKPGDIPPERPFHVDDLHPKPGYELQYVAGVALTPSDEYHGGIRFEGDHAVPKLNPGDYVVFSADVPHSGGINYSGQIRYAVYFRYLRHLNRNA